MDMSLVSTRVRNRRDALDVVVSVFFDFPVGSFFAQSLVPMGAISRAMDRAWPRLAPALFGHAIPPGRRRVTNQTASVTCRTFLANLHRPCVAVVVVDLLACTGTTACTVYVA